MKVTVERAALLKSIGHVHRVVERRNRVGGASLEAALEEVNRQLAVAHAADKGWERGALEAAS